VYLVLCRSYGCEWVDTQGIAWKHTSIHPSIMQCRYCL
ncbi:hypothetical protein AVDCRST_MAG92-854, partial [uncultured Coleofasciculus sp.]